MCDKISEDHTKSTQQHERKRNNEKNKPKKREKQPLHKSELNKKSKAQNAEPEKKTK
jgi:hypothetical protein